jgi:hypothetical protein
MISARFPPPFVPPKTSAHAKRGKKKKKRDSYHLIFHHFVGLFGELIDSGQPLLCRLLKPCAREPLRNVLDWETNIEWWVRKTQVTSGFDTYG